MIQQSHPGPQPDAEEPRIDPVEEASVESFPASDPPAWVARKGLDPDTLDDIPTPQPKGD
jgi:hypothetical protein